MTMYKKATVPLVCTYDDGAGAAYIYLQRPTVTVSAFAA
jgi:hypothetical protein